MKRLILAIAMSIVLVGCSNPKDEVIPAELNKTTMQEFAEKIKGLSEEEKALLTAYIARSEISKAFGGGSAPAGTTVAEAIENQKKWQEKLQEEEKIKAERAEKLKAEKDAKTTEFRKAVTVTVFDKSLIKGDWQSYINLDVDFKNNSGKNIDGIKGGFKFYNKFDDLIVYLTFTDDQIDLKAGQSVENELSWNFNEYMDEHIRFIDTDLKDMRYEFVPESIIFEDGTKLEMPASE